MQGLPLNDQVSGWTNRSEQKPTNFWRLTVFSTGSASLTAGEKSLARL
jgi:hypothetical protein